MKTLVTGGAGFIGSHLVDRLIEENHQVVVIDDLSSGKKENLNPKSKFYDMDIRDDKIGEILEKEKIQNVFHLAAKPIVEDIYKNPLEALSTNIMGTAKILDFCRLKNDLKSIIVVSSDKAYGKTKKLPYNENTPLSGDHPYEVSKVATDLIAQSYFSTYGLPVTIARFSNTFGPRDIYFNRIIPGIFEAIIEKKKLLIRSDGEMIREYTFVEDIVDGCVKLSEKIERTQGNAFNFGSKNIFSVVGVIKKIEEILDVSISYEILNITKNEIPKQYLDYSKAEKIINWTPQNTFEESIKKSFEWYKNFNF